MLKLSRFHPPKPSHPSTSWEPWLKALGFRLILGACLQIELEGRTGVDLAEVTADIGFQELPERHQNTVSLASVE